MPNGCYVCGNKGLCFGSGFYSCNFLVMYRTVWTVTVHNFRWARSEFSAVVLARSRKASCPHVKKSTKAESCRTLSITLKILDKRWIWIFNLWSYFHFKETLIDVCAIRDIMKSKYKRTQISVLRIWCWINIKYNMRQLNRILLK